jgi:hypothetical protein
VKIQIESRQYQSGYKFLFPLLIFSLIWGIIFIYSGIFNAGFNYFVDDHENILNHQAYTTFKDIIVNPFTALWSGQPTGRFRPVYDVFVCLYAKLYGLNPFLWYLSSFLAATTTTTVLYLIGRLQKFSWIEATGFATLIVFGQQASTYTRFGTPETTSTLLIALAFLFASLDFKNKIVQIFINYLFVFFTILSALNKEACILMIPALAFFKAWSLSQRAGIPFRIAFLKNRFNLLFLLFAFLIFIAYIKLNSINGPGYAGIDRETLSIPHLISSLTGNGAMFGVAILANIIYFITYLNKHDRVDRDDRSFYILIALIIIPQLILYNKTGMFWHYCLPAAIGVSLLTFWPIAQIRQQSMHNAKMITLIILGVISLQIIFTLNYFKDVSAHVSSIQPMLSNISSCVGKKDLLVIVGNPFIDNESLYAFKHISEKILNHDRTILATVGSQKSHLITNIWQEAEKPWLYLDVQALEKKYNGQTIKTLNPQDLSKIKGIVLNHSNTIEQPLLALKLDWFRQDLTKKYYPELQMSVYCNDRIK